MAHLLNESNKIEKGIKWHIKHFSTESLMGTFILVLKLIKSGSLGTDSGVFVSISWILTKKSHTQM